MRFLFLLLISLPAFAQQCPQGYTVTNGICVANSSSSGGTSIKTLYSRNAAANINGVGAPTMACIATNCGTATAVNTGSAASATNHIIFATASQVMQDTFEVPPGYAQQLVTLEVVFRSVDSTHSATITPTCANSATGDIANPTFAACGTAMTVTAGATSGRTVATTTFTPTWAAGSQTFWQLAFTVTSLTSDLEMISVRMYATF